MNFKLIAEVGVNHSGSVRLAKGMIDAGVAAGVKLFKFQIFTIEEISEDKAWPWYDYMNHCALSKEEHFEVANYCKEKKVTYFASVFGSWSFGVAREMKMPIYKLASRSVFNADGSPSKLAMAVYKTGKPVISSMGYRQSDWELPKFKNNINLYCVSKYPTTREDIEWPKFDRKNIRGFSDHSIGTELAKEAIDLGATIIEKHFTIDKSLYGPDQAGSATPDEMEEIQKYGNSNLSSSS
jgi:sialic acid synthase SpsE